jgi:hypothetical protein
MPSKAKSQARYEAYHKWLSEDRIASYYSRQLTVFRAASGETRSKFYAVPRSVSRLKPKPSGRNGQVMPME